MQTNTDTVTSPPTNNWGENLTEHFFMITYSTCGHHVNAVAFCF